MPGEASDRLALHLQEEHRGIRLTTFRNHEPVLARGIGRLMFEFTASPMAARSDYVAAGNSKAKSINRFLPR